MVNILGSDPFADLQQATRLHLRQHGCGAYTFEDGPALTVLSAWKWPQRVLELGTALGYTACCLAQGCALAQVDTIEGDAAHVVLAREHIARYGLASRITVHEGQFDDMLPKLVPGYEMAFFDGFAPSSTTIAQLRQLLATGGVLLCSNLQLAHGQAAIHLALELNNRRHWQALAPIEKGGTQVLIKLAT